MISKYAGDDCLIGLFGDLNGTEDGFGHVYVCLWTRGFDRLISMLGRRRRCHSVFSFSVSVDHQPAGEVSRGG